MPKPTPYNLRRFSETPIARRAINCIKDRIAGMRWRIQPRQGYALDAIPDGAARVRLLTDNFECPNPDDSFRSLAEQVLEDIIVGGFGAIEVQLSPEWSEAELRRSGRKSPLLAKGARNGAPGGADECVRRYANIAAGVVAGGWGFDPDESGVGWVATIAAVHAGEQSVGGKLADQAG